MTCPLATAHCPVPIPVDSWYFSNVLSSFYCLVCTISPVLIHMYGVSRRYDGSRPQSVSCVRLWLNRPIRDAHCRPQTRHTKVTVFDEGWVAFRLSLFSLRASHRFFSNSCRPTWHVRRQRARSIAVAPRCCEARHMILVLP